ncbi:MAG: Ntn hydrolase family protein [Candidatus Limnocylindrales bacterium]
MTIALAVTVNEGIVLASDSATTLMASDPTTGTVQGVLNVYNTANKIFNLHKGSPLGGYTFGAGSIGPAAISSLVKDFRMRLAEGEPIGPAGWVFDADRYAVEEVAVAVRHFLYEEQYSPMYAAATTKPVLGFNVAGYSSGANLPELWQILIDDTGACPDPSPLRQRGEFGISWSGEPEAIQRLVLGYGSALPAALQTIGLAPADVPAAVSAIQSQLEIGLAFAPMPVQDAIDLSEFLVHLTIQFSRFKPGAPTVGGPIEVAAITRHEGFKWVRRKYYFDPKLNPDDQGGRHAVQPGRAQES